MRKITFTLLLGFCFLALMAQGQEAPLVLHYDFTGGSATDRSGNSNNATVSATVGEGIIGEGLSFNGTNQFVVINNGNGLYPSQNFSYSAWVKFSGTIASDRTIMKASGNYGVALHNPLNTGVLQFVVCNAQATCYRATSPSNYNDNQWHHVVGVFDSTGGAIRLYVDGQLVNSAQVPAGTPAFYQTQTVAVGKNANENGRYWNGLIDEVRVYNGILNLGAVQQLRAEGLPNAPIQNVGEAHAVLRYDFTGGAAIDRSPNGNNATVSAIVGAGIVGDGLSFNGTNQFAIINGGTGLYGTQAFSYSAWIKFSGVAATDRTIIRASGNYGVALHNPANTGALQFVMATAQATFYRVTSPANYNDNQWHHVVAVFNGPEGAMGLYVDGQSVQTIDIPEGTQPHYETRTVGFGRNANESNRYWNGLIDEVRIDDGALELSGVRQLRAEALEPGTQPGTRLVLRYDFTGGAATDRSPNGNNGSSTAIRGEGIMGDGLSFNGIDQSVVKNNGTGLYMTQAITYSAWVKFSGLAPNDRTILKASGNFGVTLHNPLNTGVLQFVVVSAQANFYRATSPANYNDNQWHHVVGVFDSVGGAIRLYVDGQLVQTGQVPAGTLAFYETKTVAAGRNANETNRFFKGLIDEVRIYDGVLNLGTIQELRAEGIPEAAEENVLVINAQPGAAAGGVTDVNNAVVGINAAANLAVGIGGNEPMVDLVGLQGVLDGQVNPADGIAPGKRGDCKTLNGPRGKLHSTTVHEGKHAYTACLGWDDAGYLSKIVNPAGYLTELEFDSLGRPTVVRDPLGEVRQNSYDSQSRLSQVTTSNNFNPNQGQADRTNIISYDSLGNPIGNTIQGGAAFRQHYTPDDQTKSVVGPDGVLGSFTHYDATGRVDSASIGEVDPQGEMALQGLGESRYQYDEFGRIQAVRDGEMRWTRFHYDNLGRIDQVTNPDNSVLALTYDAPGNIKSRELRTSGGIVLQRIELDYDMMNRTTKMRITQPGNNTIWKTDWEYKDNGISVIRSRSLGDQTYETVTFFYDTLGRLSFSTLPGGGSFNSTYDSAGHLDRVEHSANGLMSRYQYDALGRMRFIRDGLNNITGYGYDGLGNLANIYPAAGSRMEFHYDINGRLISSATGLKHLNFAYDAAGRLQQTRASLLAPGDEVASVTSNYRRETGLLENTRDPQGNARDEVMERNQNGQIKRWHSPNGISFTQDYDVMGRPTLLTATKEGGTQYHSTSYDAAGRPLVIADSLGSAPDRFREVTSGADPIFPCGLPRAVCRLLGRPLFDSHLKSVIRYRYDPSSNVIEEKRWVQGRWFTSTTVFEAANGLRAVTSFPSGYRVERTSDTAGRLTQVRGTYNNNPRGVVNYTYQLNSMRLDKIRFTGDVGTEERYIYDAAGKITRVSVFRAPLGGDERQLSQVDYKYSPVGMEIARKEQVFPTANVAPVIAAFTTGYDNINRLAWFSGVAAATADGVANNAAAAPASDNAIERIFLNPTDNRVVLTVKDNAGALTGQQNLQRSLEYSLRWDGTSERVRQGSCWFHADGSMGGCADANTADTSFNPDPNGNLMTNQPVGGQGLTYDYDLLDHLLTINDAASNRRIDYTYDGLDRLIRRRVTLNGRTSGDQEFVWDGAALSEIRDIITRNRSGEVTGEVMTSYLYGLGPNDVIASYDRRWVRYHHHHPAGSTFLLTYEGDVTQWFRYTPFGETRVMDWINNAETQRTLAESKSPRLFGGAYIDPITGYYFMGYWYDPVHGHTLSAEK